MTTPLSATQNIADLVKGWADRIDAVDLVKAVQTEDNTEQSRELDDIAEEMRAFSNGLLTEVDNFRWSLARLWNLDDEYAHGIPEDS